MPRFARPHRPGALHHLIGRFVDREFRLSNDEERGEYLRRLGDSLARCDWHLIGYALMSSHVHLCAVAGHDPSERLIRSLHGGFAGWLNRRQGRLGPLFAERHTSIVLGDDRARRLLAYVHCNPVRARVASRPEDTSWTSHRAYVGAEAAPPWLDVRRGLALCGLRNGDEGRRLFAAEVHAAALGERDAELSGGHLRRARAEARLLAGAPVELGAEVRCGDTAVHEIRAAPETPLRPRWPGSAAALLERVTERTGVSLERMHARDRSRPVVRARRLALQTWTHRLHRSQIEMSLALGLAAQSASALLRRAPPCGYEVDGEVEMLAQLCWDAVC